MTYRGRSWGMMTLLVVGACSDPAAPAASEPDADAAQPDASARDDAGTDADGGVIPIDASAAVEVDLSLPPSLVFERSGALGSPALGSVVRVEVREADGRGALSAFSYQGFAAPCEADCLRLEALPPRALDSAALAAITALREAIPAGDCYTTSFANCDPAFFEDLTVGDTRYPIGGCVAETCTGHFASLQRLANLLERLATPEQTITDTPDCNAPGRGTSVLDNPGCACDWPHQLVCADGVLHDCGDPEQRDVPHERWTVLRDEPCVPRGGEPCASAQAPSLEVCMKSYRVCFPADGGGYCGL